jgi:hypothetical protein
MHAVVVKVAIAERDNAQEHLENQVVPNVSQAPGFVAGYWTHSGNEGLSMVIFDSEDSARQAADRVPQAMPEFVKLESVDVREVVASA